MTADPHTLAALQAENERLKLAILDIDAHATPLGEDADGFVAVGYAISVGSLHRALGVVGHSAARCSARKCPHDVEATFPLWDAWTAAKPACKTCGGRGVVDGDNCWHPKPCPYCPLAHPGVQSFGEWCAGLVALWTAVHDDDTWRTTMCDNPKRYLRQIGASR